MEDDLYTLVLKAQRGDKLSLEAILKIFSPILHKQMRMVDLNDQDDLLQNLIEILIDKIISFDTEYLPEFFKLQCFAGKQIGGDINVQE